MLYALYKKIFCVKYNLIFALIFTISFLLKIIPVTGNNIGFAYDQARDMLDIRNIVIGHHLTLIGPTTSLNGVFLGPFWYYLNFFPFILGSGNPTYLVYWLIILFQLTAFLIFIFLNKRSPLLALLTSTFFLMSPLLFYASKVSWSANPMPIFISLFFLSLFSSLKKPANFNTIIQGLIIGLALQIEAAFGVLLLPFTLLLYVIKKFHVKYFFTLMLGFTITLIPQILFELKHNFLMTNVLINEVTGKTAVLGKKLSFTEALISHANSYLNSTHAIFELPYNLNNFLLAAAIIFLIIRLLTKKIDLLNKQYFLMSLLFIIYSFLFYLIYAQNLKSWYLLGLIFPYLLIIAVSCDEIFRLQRKNIAIGASLVILLLMISAATKQANYIPKGLNRSADENNLQNQMETIDWIYQSANGEGFKVFSYLPSVYDFPYQYLFWWYATPKYGYQPDTIGYLDNVPEYIPQNNAYFTKKRGVQKKYKTFLIVQTDKEMPNRRLAWLGNFDNLCLKETRKFPWNTEVWLKVGCSREVDKN